MRIEKKGNQELIIYENIKSIDDFVAIREAVTKIVNDGGGELQLSIPDSFSMPSSVIGFLIQMINEGKLKLRMRIGDKNLFELLDEMKMAGGFAGLLRIPFAGEKRWDPLPISYSTVWSVSSLRMCWKMKVETSYYLLQNRIFQGEVMLWKVS